MDTSTRSAVLEDLAAASRDFAQDGELVIPARTWVAEATV